MEEQVQQFIDKSADDVKTIATAVQDIDREIGLADGLSDEAKERIRAALETILRRAA